MLNFFEAVQILMPDFQQQFLDEDKNVLSKYLLFYLRAMLFEQPFTGTTCWIIKFYKEI